MEVEKELEIINRELEIENNTLVQNIEKRKEQIKILQDENKKLREELDKIIYSRSYKMMQKIKGIIKRG